MAIIKAFDKEKQEWLEVVAKPVAEEVVKIMKEDWLETKGQIDYLLVEADTQYGDTVRVAVFYNTAQENTDIVSNQQNYKISLETHLKSVTENLPTPKNFNLNDFIERLQIYDIMPDTFNLNAQIENSEGNSITVPKLSTVTSNPNITNALIDEDSKLEVRYIYNDHPIEDKKLVKEKK